MNWSPEELHGKGGALSTPPLSLSPVSCLMCAVHLNHPRISYPSFLFVFFPSSVFGACQCQPAMAEQDPPADKLLAASHFTIGSVSEDNSEDETLGRLELSAEDKERSASPSSLSSDSTFECLDGPPHSMRSGSRYRATSVFVRRLNCARLDNALIVSPGSASTYSTL